MNGTAFKAAVIGWPVAHSLSPLIHNYWIEKYGLSGSYEARALEPARLKAGVRELIAQGYAGFNVTLPHKQDVAALCDGLDETALKIGAVNTVTIADGKLSGMNTDWFGFVENIAETAPKFHFSSGTALVLGAGGAARAVIYGLQCKGVRNIRVANRTMARASLLAKSFGIEAVAWEKREEAGRDAALLVNTTSLGMAGKEPLAFDVGILPSHALVSDIVYRPLRTKLLADAAARGLDTVEGLGMLLHQARPAFAAWTGILPDVDEALKAKIAREFPA